MHKLNLLANNVKPMTLLNFPNLELEKLSGSLPVWWEDQLKFALLLLISKVQIYESTITMNHSKNKQTSKKKQQTFCYSSQFHDWEKTQDGHFSKDIES